MPLNTRLTRRTALTTIAATATGAAALTRLTRPASAASIAFDTLDIPDRTFTSSDGVPARILVFTDVRAAWTLDREPASATVYMFLRDAGGGFHSMAEHTYQSPPADAERTASLVGNILATDAYAATDFTAPGPGKQTTETVTLGVLVQVNDADGTTLVDADATRDVTLTVNQESLTADVGATGNVVMQDDASTTTPTPP